MDKFKNETGKQRKLMKRFANARGLQKCTACGAHTTGKFDGVTLYAYEGEYYCALCFKNKLKFDRLRGKKVTA